MTRARATIAGAMLAAMSLPWAVAAAASCECAAAGRIDVGNGSRVETNLRANDVGGLVHVGRHAFLSDGTSVGADRVELWNGASVFDASGRVVTLARGATVRGTITATAPPPDPLFCGAESPACGGSDVVVHRGDAPRDLTPGGYGLVALENGTTVRLAAGRYDLCMLRVGRNATVALQDPMGTDVRVVGDVELENGATLGGASGMDAPLLTVAGALVKIGAGGHVRAHLRAPNATLRLGRGVDWVGDGCAARIATARNVSLACGAAVPTSTSSTTSTSTTSATSSTSSTSTSSTTTTSSPTTSSTTTSIAPTTSSTSTSTSSSVPTTTSTSTTTQPLGSSTTSSSSSTSSSTSTTSSSTITTTSIAASTSSTSTSTTSPSTTTTSLPASVDCGPNGVDVVVAVPYGAEVPALGGISLDLTYAANVSIPGNLFETEERSTELTGLSGTLTSIDRDANTDGTDDTLRIVYTLTGGRTFPPGNLASVWFDCLQGSAVAVGHFGCSVQSASDAVGNPVQPGTIPCGVVTVSEHP